MSPSARWKKLSTVAFSFFKAWSAALDQAEPAPADATDEERMVHGLMPSEKGPTPMILTGGEFSTWRKTKGWSQEEAALTLGVSRWTVMRAESSPDDALKGALQEALDKLR